MSGSGGCEASLHISPTPLTTLLMNHIFRLFGNQNAKIKLCASTSAKTNTRARDQISSGEVGGFEPEREGGDGFQ